MQSLGAVKAALTLVGNNLDVISLAKASMVCTLWKKAFDNHPNWESFYLKSYEYRMHPERHTEGPWKIRYSELYNRCNSIARNFWKIEKYRPTGENKERMVFRTDCFYVNEKLVFYNFHHLFMQSNQLPPHEKSALKELGLQKTNKYTIKRKTTMVTLPVSTNGYCHLHDAEVDKEHVYVYCTSRKGEIFCWERNRFPFGFSKIITRGSDPSKIKVHNGVVYLCSNHTVVAMRGAEILWAWNKNTGGGKNNFAINDTLGMFIVGDLQVRAGNLFMWDPQVNSEPKMMGSVKNFALLGKEVITATDDEILGYSLDGIRSIAKMNCQNLNWLTSNEDQDLVYLLTAKRYLTTVDIHGIREKFTVDLGILEINSFTFANGILYCVDLTGTLLLINPNKGVIRKGTKSMFYPGKKITVHGGKVFGVNFKNDGAVVCHAANTKYVRNI